MGILKFILSKKGVYAGIAILLFSGGVAALYYVKYRPVRNELISLRATNKELKKNLETQKFMKSLILEEYAKLANLPRYQIDQHLDKIKIKRGSSLDFSPDAMLTVLDSVKSINEGDSTTIILPDTVIKKRNWAGRQLKKIGDWFR